MRFGEGMNDFQDISGTTEIGNEGIKKHFKSIELWQPIIELIWNGFDAKATCVAVELIHNSMDSLQNITVLDNGEGIDPTTLKDTFGRFYDSNKNDNAEQHGAHGRGRLAFHKLCQFATWHSKSIAGNLKIGIDAASIKQYKANTVSEEDLHSQLRSLRSGTFVQLENFNNNLPILDRMIELFAIEFGGYLVLHPDSKLTLNDQPIQIPTHDLFQEEVNIEGTLFNVQVIRWDVRPSSEKSFNYLLNSQGIVVYKELSTLNNKPNFYTSVYISSSWADNFVIIRDLVNPNANDLNTPVWKKLTKKLNEITQKIYEDFLRSQAGKEVDKYIEDGLFPAYSELTPDQQEWRMSNTKELVTTIYMADPALLTAASKKQRKIIIRLLDKLSVSNENEALFDVLNSVLDLDERAVKALADQLKQTTLENIIATIEMLQRRQLAVSKLRTLMNDHYLEVLETPDLQSIIENNTWLFGPGYEILGAEEDTFTKVAKQLRDQIPNIQNINKDDLDEEGEIIGAKRQADLFLARRIPSINSNGEIIYRCILIEIKRPSISLNIKHLRQLDDYANIIKKHAEFGSEKMYFELILVGRKISSEDSEIKSRLNNQIARREPGLVSDDPRMKRYVHNWYTILDSFELTNNFLLEQLKLKRTEFEAKTKSELIEELQTVNSKN